MILENGVNINNQELLDRYFSFKAVWQEIVLNEASYRVTLEAIDTEKYGLYDINKNIKKLLDYRSGEIKNLEIPWLTSEKKADMSCLERSMNLNDGRFYSQNKQYISQLTKNGEFVFTEKTAVLLWLFLLLHQQAHCNIHEKTDDIERQNKWDLKELNGKTAMEFMMSELQKEGFTDNANIKYDSEFYIPDDMERFVLPFWDGTLQTNAPMEVVKIINGSNHCTVILEGTTLKRFLRPGEYLYAVRKGGAFVHFLPRFSVSGTMCITAGESGLNVSEKGGGSRKWNTEPVTEPSTWSYSSGIGLFAADAKGRLHVTSTQKISMLSKKVISVHTSCEDYALLLADGTLQSNIWKFDKQKNLLSISLGLNSAAAIRNNCTVVWSDGTPISTEEDGPAVEVCTYEKHFIWLDAAGRAHTDKGLLDENGIAAVGICQYGYVYAKESNIYKVDFHNLRKSIQHTNGKCEINEISVSNEVLVYKSTDEKCSFQWIEITR